MKNNHFSEKALKEIILKKDSHTKEIPHYFLALASEQTGIDFLIEGKTDRSWGNDRKA